jgi:hypothetical protein
MYTLHLAVKAEAVGLAANIADVQQAKVGEHLRRQQLTPNEAVGTFPKVEDM